MLHHSGLFLVKFLRHVVGGLIITLRRDLCGSLCLNYGIDLSLEYKINLVHRMRPFLYNDLIFIVSGLQTPLSDIIYFFRSQKMKHFEVVQIRLVLLCLNVSMLTENLG